MKENTEIQQNSGSTRKGSIKDFIDGSLLTRQNVINQLPFLLFLTLLGILYIGNRYHAEKILRETNVLERELKEFRSEYITTASELMYISKQGEVKKLIDQQDLGLVESVEPPKKIVITKKDKY